MSNNQRFIGSTPHINEPGMKNPLIISPAHRSSQKLKHNGAVLHLNRRLAAKLCINLLGVSFLLVAVGVIMAQADGSLKGRSTSPICLGQLLCGKNGIAGTSAYTLAKRSTNVRTPPFATPTLTGIGSHMLTPTPAGPSPTPTPVYPVLSVRPASITLIYSSLCGAHNVAMLIQFQDTGGQPVIWRQGPKTSAGFSVSASPEDFLIQPGHSARVKLSCSSKDVIGHYHIQIQYNGGTLTIPIVVTNSRT